MIGVFSSQASNVSPGVYPHGTGPGMVSFSNFSGGGGSFVLDPGSYIVTAEVPDVTVGVMGNDSNLGHQSAVGPPVEVNINLWRTDQNGLITATSDVVVDFFAPNAVNLYVPGGLTTNAARTYNITLPAGGTLRRISISPLQ